MATTVRFSDLGGLVDSTTSVIMSSSWIPSDYLWALVYGFIVAFILAFAVGANDVANSFGTTVGANVLTVKTACILASIFETLGAICLGAKVGETIRKGIIDVNVYNDTEYGPEMLMIGEISAMTGAAVWQLIATVLGLPVSGTHSIVGACIGFSIVAVGLSGVNWTKLGFIIASWFISPILSGVMTVALYIFIKKVILEKDEPLTNGLRCLPFFYAFAFGINSFSIFYTGAPLLGLYIPFWGIVLVTIALMVVVGTIVQLIVVPRIRRKAVREQLIAMEEFVTPQSSISTNCETSRYFSNNRNNSKKFDDSGYQTPNIVDKIPNDWDNKFDEKEELSTSIKIGSQIPDHDEISKELVEDSLETLARKEMRVSYLNSSESELESALVLTDTVYKSKQGDCYSEVNTAEKDEIEDTPSVRLIFSSLQILTACFGSFAHGGNDVSNAIGPLIALWMIYHSGEVVQSASTPWYLLLYGGLGIMAGLWILGRRVIKTIGSDLTKITPSRGFCIELMTALTVLLASNVGIPVSTTHCKVGSVVSIGWFRSRAAVTWSTVRNISIAWFVTVPISGLISAGVMYIMLLIVAQ